MYEGKTGRANCHADFCVSKFCSEFVRGKIFAIDSEKERTMQFGREWYKQYSTIPPRTAYITYELAETLKLKVGDIMIIPISNVEGIFRESGIVTDNRVPKIRRVDVPFLVGSIFNNFETVLSLIHSLV
jgi:hypothetical protein